MVALPVISDVLALAWRHVNVKKTVHLLSAGRIQDSGLLYFQHNNKNTS